MRLQTESVIIDDQIPEIPQERLERMYPAQKVSIWQDGYREVDISELASIVWFDDIKDCPRPEEITTEEFDALPKFKGEAALIRYAAYLSGYNDEQSFLDAQEIKIYKCWRNKKYISKNWQIFYALDYLQNNIYWCDYAVKIDNVLYIREAERSSQKRWVKLNWELLFVYTSYVYYEEVVPFIDCKIPKGLANFTKQMQQNKRVDIKEEKRKIMKETLELINGTNYNLSNFKEQRLAIRKKYKDDIRIKSIDCSKNGVIAIEFKWRRVEDSVGVFNKMILPPLNLSINIFNGYISHNTSHNRHPHCLRWNDICLWAYKMIISRMVASLSLEGIVDALVNFACTFTGTDCWSSSRAPRYCLQTYLKDTDYIINPELRASDITYRDLMLGLRTRAGMFEFAQKLGDLLIPTVGYIDFMNHNPDSEYYVKNDRYRIWWDARPLLEAEVEETRTMYPSNELMQMQQENSSANDVMTHINNISEF